MLSHTKKTLTLTETVFSPLFDSLMKVCKLHDIPYLSMIFLIRIKDYQTLHNRFIYGQLVMRLFTNDLQSYRIYLTHLVNKELIEYVNTGTEELNGYNVTPKGERVLAYLTTLYNKKSKDNIRAHQDTRVTAKPFKEDKFEAFFSKTKNPNTHLKGKQPDHLKGALPPKGYKLAKRQQILKEREIEDKESINNIRAEIPEEPQTQPKKSANPFKF